MLAMRHRGSRLTRLGGMAAVLLWGACASPAYRDDEPDDAGAADAGPELGEMRGREAGAARQDATVPPTTTRDAEMPPDAEVADADAGTEVVETPPTMQAGTPPAWAAPMLGQYGIRSRFFQRNQQLGTPGKVEWVMLGEFAYDAANDRVTLTTQFCETLGNSTYLPGVSADSGPQYPRKLPKRVYTVTSDGATWSTDNAPLHIGFDPTPLVPCPTPGARVPRHGSQIWNTDGLCTCPADPNVLPIHSTDCRINDVDDDGSPAATVVVSGAVAAKFHVRHYDSSRIVNGLIDPIGRHHDAKQATAQDLYQLTCGAQPCAAVPIWQCDSSLNPVRVSPLGPSGDTERYDCDDVVTRKAELFGTDALAFPPSGC